MSEKWIESPHDKTNKTTCAPSEDLDQPGHPPSSLSALWVAKDPRVLHADSKDSDLSGRAHRSFCLFCPAQVNFIQICYTYSTLLLLLLDGRFLDFDCLKCLLWNLCPARTGRWRSMHVICWGTHLVGTLALNLRSLDRLYPFWDVKCCTGETDGVSDNFFCYINVDHVIRVLDKKELSHIMTKLTKWCVPSKDSDQPGHSAKSDHSLCCALYG